MNDTNVPQTLTLVLKGWDLDIQPEQVSVKYRKYWNSLPKECYRNSFNYVGENINTRSYILGYFMYKDIPIEHAWVKEENLYYDVTLDNRQDNQYYKLVEISGSDLMGYILQTRQLIDIYMYKRIIEGKEKLMQE